jgi:uncharacterized membrane protein
MLLSLIPAMPDRTIVALYVGGIWLALVVGFFLRTGWLLAEVLFVDLGGWLARRAIALVRWYRPGRCCACARWTMRVVERRSSRAVRWAHLACSRTPAPSPGQV